MCTGFLVHVHVYVRACLYVHTSVCMYARTYVCMYVCMCARMYVCMYVCMCAGGMSVCVHAFVDVFDGLWLMCIYWERRPTIRVCLHVGANRRDSLVCFTVTGGLNLLDPWGLVITASRQHCPLRIAVTHVCQCLIVVVVAVAFDARQECPDPGCKAREVRSSGSGLSRLRLRVWRSSFVRC